MAVNPVQKLEFKDLGYILQSIQDKFKERYQSLNIEKMLKDLSDMKSSLEDPNIWTDTLRSAEARSTQSKISNLEKSIESWSLFKKEMQDIEDYFEIAQMENEVSLLSKLEKDILLLKEQLNKLDLESLLTEEDDFRNAFLNVHPGAGGVESQDWADMLYRAYVRWAEKKNFTVEIVDYQDGEEAGIKNVTLLIKGVNVFGFLKSENGVHRLVRISPFDANKKRHTSFASIHVCPEISDDIDIEILEKDLKVDTYRSSGAGGQHVNKTDSAVRMTHMPTGIVVTCQSERSQIKNRSTALKMLKARLYELAKMEKNKEIESKSGERKDISWGNQIRSYVFHPYNMVKDLRTNVETGNIQAVMDGSFDLFIDAYLRQISIVS